MNLNRTIAPELILPSEVEIRHAFERKLANGVGLYVIDSGDDEVVKFEVLFPSYCHDAATLTTSLACHQLVDSGTSSMTAREIAGEFDFYGSFFQAHAGPDFKSFSLYSLTGFFKESLHILASVLYEAAFPDEEVRIWKQRNIQALAVNREKVAWLAKTMMNELLYGKDHPYGCTPDEHLFNDVEAGNLRKFFKEYYPVGNAIMIVSGKISESIIEAINSVFGSGDAAKIPLSPLPAADKLKSSDKLRIPKSEAVQSGIRVGRTLFSRTHPDFQPMLVVNTILGGYFGSRLMSNIREDKGYTYGIGSGIHSFLHAGTFVIHTEVGADVREKALEEIYFELRRLSEEPVPEDELLLVKNYLFGAFQRSLDGPFELAERFKILKMHGLDYDYFNNYLQILNKISAKEIQELAFKYLLPDYMSEVVVG